MQVLVIGILPPDTPLSEVPEVFARLVQQYAINGEIRPYKVYLDEQELWLRWRESLPADPLEEVGLASDTYTLDAEPECDRYGYYEWHTESLQQEWWSWHIGGRWDGILQGKPVRARPTCDCEEWEEHLQHNVCRVADLPPGLWPRAYVTPDSEWRLVCGVRDDQATDYQGRTFKQIVAEYQEYLAVIVGCQVPPQEDADDPVTDAFLGSGLEEMDAFVDPEEAADIDAGNPFRAGSPPVVTHRSRLYMWARASNRRVRAWWQERPPASAEELLEAWLLRLQSKLALTTLWRTHRAFFRFLKWYVAQRQQLPVPADLTPWLLDEYAATLRISLAPNTMLSHLRAIETWGRGLNDRPMPSAARRLGLKPVNSRTTFLPQPLNEYQVQALLQAAARSEFPTRDQAILLLLLSSGIPIGELAQLAWQDIQLGEIPGQVWLQVRTSAGARQIPLCTQMYQTLIRYRAALPQVDPTLQPLEETGITSSSDQPRGPLWQRQDGRPLSQRVLSQIIAALAQETRMIVPPGRALRQIRSTFIHEYLSCNPESFDGLAIILGIRRPTLQRYSHFVNQRLAERLGLLYPGLELG